MLFRLVVLILCVTHAWSRDPFSFDSREEIKSVSIKIQYANAKDLFKNITQNKEKFLSHSGQIVLDERTNALWIEDDKPHIQKVKKYVLDVDLPIQQILIRAKIVMMDRQSFHELGTYFTSESSGQAQNIDLSAPLTVPILNTAKEKLLGIQLIALEAKGHAHIVATPELVTNNRHSAQIESGEELPYQEKSGMGNTSIAFKKAVLQLKVTPTILPNGQILMDLQVSQNKTSHLMVQGVPSIVTQRLKTAVIVDNRHTLVLGGIAQRSQDESVHLVPILGQLPLFGALFSNKTQSYSDKQLVIFITPHIL